MKISLLSVATASILLAVTGCSRAEPGCGEHAVYGTTDQQGRKVELVLSSAAVEKGPSWSPGESEPPLSISKASRIALEWAKRKYSRYDTVEIREIVLVPYSCSIAQNRWYYRFEFTPVMDGNRMYGVDNFAAVLMDGSVVAPVRSPR
jgi:hypothetical protein